MLFKTEKEVTRAKALLELGLWEQLLIENGDSKNTFVKFGPSSVIVYNQSSNYLKTKDLEDTWGIIHWKTWR